MHCISGLDQPGTRQAHPDEIAGTVIRPNIAFHVSIGELIFQLTDMT